MKMIVARFSFGVIASLLFAIYFELWSFTSTNNSSKHSVVVLKKCYALAPLLNGIQKGEYTPNT